MITKIAIKNVGKSIKDYMVYFFTLSFSVCIFYMFNSIYAQEAVIALNQYQSQSIKTINGLLAYVSVFVAVLLGFLIIYANDFFIKRRKREFGIYMSLGLDRMKISAILLIETIIVAIFALIVGLLAGVFLSQFMSIFTAKIFEADMSKFQFVFSFSAVVKSILSFGVLFAIVIVFNVFNVSKLKLIDMIYSDKKNQENKIKNIKVQIPIFIISVIMLFAAYYLIITNGIFELSVKFLFAIILGINGTLLFYFSLSDILIWLIKKNKKVYFKNLNAFILNQLASKINTNFISISIISIVLLLTIGIFSTGYSMQKLFSSEIKESAASDFTFHNLMDEENGLNDDFTKIKNYLKSEGYDGKSEICNFYLLEEEYGYLADKLINNDIPDVNSKIQAVSLSEFNNNMRLQNKEEIELKENQYGLLSNINNMNETVKEILSKEIELKVGDESLKPKVSIKGSLRNTVDQLIIIVPDRYVNTLEQNSVVMNYDLMDKELVNKMEDELTNDVVVELGGGYFTSKAKIYAEAVGNRAMLSFIAIYLGSVFMMSSAVILAIQQLTEASDNKHRYKLLKKLGVDSKDINKGLFLQILCYFSLPLILAVIDSIFGLWAVNDALIKYGGVTIGTDIVVTIAFIGVMYLIYFILTYTCSKNIINRD